jgi:hypothetical protein
MASATPTMKAKLSIATHTSAVPDSDNDAAVSSGEMDKIQS